MAVPPGNHPDGKIVSRRSAWAAFLFFLVSVLVLVIRPAYSSGLALNDFVQHFEPLFYDHDDLRFQHQNLDHPRSKRSNHNQDPQPHLRLQFHAHNRLFKIRLRRSASNVFAEDAQLESSKGRVKYDMGRIYQGELEDDDQSSVSAVLSPSGHLDATVSTASETYYVEPASRYFDDPLESFPAVIYKASDVLHPEPQGCSSHHFYLKHFEEEELRKRSCRRSNDCDVDANRPNNRSHPAVIKQYIPPASDSFQEQLIDRTLYSGWDRRQQQRSKKNKRSSSIDSRKTTCMLYLQADHLFYAKMGSEEACIETMTRHVQRVNSIYKNIDFDGDDVPDEINFMIKRIKVHTEDALNEASYRFPGNYGVEKFLELFSEEDYNAFCLAYMFTYRDFEGGTLGLAWTGDLKNAGGVCEKNGHYRGSLKSLNTGIVTLLNYGKHVPPAVSHVTLAHEIGHNFGSPHDPENNRDCTPGGEDGNYIMFARATSGDKRNNNKFSPCSLKSINGVLSSKARNDLGCFTEPQSAICGNGVVESGEECDCGWEEDCTERCCFPMRSNPQPAEKPCTLRPSRSCSPSQGPCCTEDCHFRYDVKCRDDNGCRDAAYCDGTGPKCPLSNNKPNKTVCNEEFVCFMGECTGSICIAYGLQSCQCLQGPGDPPTKACELCCKLPGDDQPCLSSFEWNTSPYDVPDAHAKAGTPCNNYNGYCDVFQRCREVDPSGPLATLRRLLLSDESIASLKKWIEDHWYGVLFIVVGFVTVIVVAARLFGKRVQKIRQTARQQRISRTNGVTSAAVAAATAAAVDESQNQHIVHPIAVRTKIPLNRKVREKEKRAGKKASSSSKTLAILRRANRTTATAAADPRSRQRRSGVVSTKEKVQSWLERENPTRETVDSDNESNFPEEDEPVKDHNIRRHSMDAKLSSRICQPNLVDTAEAPVPIASGGGKKMMRSISEMTRPRQADLRIPHGRHNYSRSISQPHHPNSNNNGDFRGLGRKTESHSHLLSKSCDLDVVEPPSKVTDEENCNSIIPAVKEEDVIVVMQPAPHQLPKSATDFSLKKSCESVGIKKMRFMSTDFINNLFASSNQSHRKPEKRSRSLPEASKEAANNTENSKKTVRKKIGLGPVKVVLKWHGGGATAITNTSGRHLKAKRSGSPKKSVDRNKKKRKVIVYKNGNPTTSAATHKVVEVIESASAAPSVNITLNPRSSESSSPPDKCRPSLPETGVIFTSRRRYSMQERTQPAAGLTRRVSEIQHPAAIVGSSRLVMNNVNQKRNRHSWTSTTSAGALPRDPDGQISIDID